MIKPAALSLALSSAILVLSISPLNSAQENSNNASDNKTQASEIENILIMGRIGYRNRTDEALQTLQYDQSYFQRFEPLTAGDALKRIPSVTFLSDVLESDGARMRGLNPGYTQITINGEKVPGSNSDRSFFMDRIPAELIERVEIIRSSSATRSGDAIAGTLNIVLRDAQELEGGYIKVGGLHYRDSEIKENLGIVWGSDLVGGHLLIGANIQGRYNPKYKESLRYKDSPENDPDFAINKFDNREDQPDTRNGTDQSFNMDWSADISPYTRVEISGIYVTTERTETELKYEYDDPIAINAPISFGGNLVEQADELTEIDQKNYSTELKLEHNWNLGETDFKLSFAKFSENIYATDHEIEFEKNIVDSVYEASAETAYISDKEISFKADHEFDLNEDIELEIGLFLQSKERQALYEESDQNELDPITPIPSSWNQFSNTPTNTYGSTFINFSPIDAGDSEIQENRADLFAALEGETKNLKWEVGVRYETTDVDIRDATVSNIETLSNDYSLVLPSATLPTN